MTKASPAAAIGGTNRLSREQSRSEQPTIFLTETKPDKQAVGIWAASRPYRMELRMTPWILGLQLYWGL